MTGEWGKFVGVRHPRERARTFGIERARTAHVDIKSGVGRSRLDIERLASGLERLGDRPGGAKRTVKSGGQNGAFVYRDDVMRARRGKAHLPNVALATSRIQHNPPPASPMHAYQ